MQYALVENNGNTFFSTALRHSHIASARSVSNISKRQVIGDNFLYLIICITSLMVYGGREALH
jgi:hypothetical protein